MQKEVPFLENPQRRRVRREEAGLWHAKKDGKSRPFLRPSQQEIPEVLQIPARIAEEARGLLQGELRLVKAERQLQAPQPS